MSCAATIYWPSGSADQAACIVMGNGVTLTKKDVIPDYAQRFAESGFVVVAFDYRCWGDSDGQPRRWVSLRNQLEDWHAEHMPPNRGRVVWGHTREAWIPAPF